MSLAHPSVDTVKILLSREVPELHSIFLQPTVNHAHTTTPTDSLQRTDAPSALVAFDAVDPRHQPRNTAGHVHAPMHDARNYTMVQVHDTMLQRRGPCLPAPALARRSAGAEQPPPTPDLRDATLDGRSDDAWPAAARRPHLDQPSLSTHRRRPASPKTSPPELPMPNEMPRATTTDPDEALESTIHDTARPMRVSHARDPAPPNEPLLPIAPLVLLIWGWLH